MTLHAKFVELTLNRVIYWYDGVKKMQRVAFLAYTLQNHLLSFDIYSDNQLIISL